MNRIARRRTRKLDRQAPLGNNELKADAQTKPFLITVNAVLSFRFSVRRNINIKEIF